MDQSPSSARDARGRFVPGQSGKPRGKLPGTRNRATLMREALAAGEGAAVARVLVEKALAGNAVTARFLMTRLEPAPRGRSIALDLPETGGPGAVVAAYDAGLAALAAGEITPDEAATLGRFLEGRLKALEAARREGARDDNPASGERVAKDAAAPAPHPDPLPAGGAREEATLAPLGPLPACGEREGTRGSGEGEGHAPALGRLGEADACISSQPPRGLPPAFPLHPAGD